jgi:hypothetical protein
VSKSIAGSHVSFINLNTAKCLAVFSSHAHATLRRFGVQNVGDCMKVGTAGDRTCVNSWVTLAGACGRFEIKVGKTSIGADISVFSQFEDEKEYLYAPLTHLQLLGKPRLEDHNGKQLSVLSMQLTGEGWRGHVLLEKKGLIHICLQSRRCTVQEQTNFLVTLCVSPAVSHSARSLSPLDVCSQPAIQDGGAS